MEVKSNRSLAAILLVLLAGCARGSQADLQYIAQARSLSAEWALVNELDSQHRLNRTYVDSMHEWLMDGLKTASHSLSQPQSDYGAEIRALLESPPGAPARVLRAHSARLKMIEDRLESA